MDLFEQLAGRPDNLLPRDGIVNYYGPIMSLSQADHYYEALLNSVAWKQDQAVINDEVIMTKRKVAWYGDHAFSYTYSKITKTAMPWLPVLLELRELVQEKTGESYNSCLLNLYHDGQEGMTWHSDGEKDLKRNGAIGSLSFGAERKFAFKHKDTGAKASRILEHGSLLVMKGTTQTHWLHSLPITKTITHPRINLTFRYIVRQKPS